MRTHTYQYQLATTPVPASTPPEHRPNTEDMPGTWDHLVGRGADAGRCDDVEAE